MDASRRYPVEWSVDRALDAYLEMNGFEREEYEAKIARFPIGPFVLPFPNPPSRRRAIRFHDLHHVATGFGTDLPGEAEISAWELRGGLAGLSVFVRAIVTFGAFAGLLRAPTRTRRAWRAASGAKNLFEVDAGDGYEGILEMTVGELRDRLGVPREGIAREHGLHAAAHRSAA